MGNEHLGSILKNSGYLPLPRSTLFRLAIGCLILASVTACFESVPVSIDTTDLLPQDLSLAFLKQNQYVRKDLNAFGVDDCTLHPQGIGGIVDDAIHPYSVLKVCNYEDTTFSFQHIHLAPNSCWASKACLYYNGDILAPATTRKMITAFVSLGATQEQRTSSR